jgi:hypothetical protein
VNHPHAGVAAAFERTRRIARVWYRRHHRAMSTLRKATRGPVEPAIGTLPESRWKAMRAVRRFGLLLAALPALTPSAGASSPAEVEAVFPAARALYIDLHEHPELSGHETRTAATLAAALRKLGYQVTEHVGGTGIVAVLRNGPGPTIMLRTELDALPVQERTGLPFASHVRVKDDAGNEVYVGHMCGHDLHMSALVATADVLAHSRDTWHGTLELIGQPAEETIGGASRMVKDGLFTRFPRPGAVLALHVSNELPAGEVGVVPGIYDTSSDSVRITIFGRGGHGSMPEATIDPIVIAARTILALQTIVSREVKPGEMAVVTVGYVRRRHQEQHHSRSRRARPHRAHAQARGAPAGAERHYPHRDGRGIGRRGAEASARRAVREHRCGLQRPGACRANAGGAADGARERECPRAGADHGVGGLLGIR